MIRITHIITGLAADGAESMLRNLLSEMDRTKFSNTVVSLTTMGKLGDQMQKDGIDVYAIGLKKSPLDVLSLRRLKRAVHSAKPDLVQTWMYHADLVGGILAQSSGSRVPVIWGVHHASLALRTDKLSTLATAKACAYLSCAVPARIIFCSETGKRSHEDFGYDRRKTEFIPNGFDLKKFKPDASARTSVREEFGIPADTILIGMAARAHAHKDHETFIRAAALLTRERPDVGFVLCGAGVVATVEPFSRLMHNPILRKKFHLLGSRTDVNRLLAAFDIATSSSRTEAFPLSIGEAMSAGIPCVVTDVGDSAQLVGEAGLVVPPGDPESLAAAWKLLIDHGPEARARLGTAARRRIALNFSLQATARRYEALYSGLVQN